MIIRKQPIISWLLDNNNTADEENLGIPMLETESISSICITGCNILQVRVILLQTGGFPN